MTGIAGDDWTGTSAWDKAERARILQLLLDANECDALIYESPLQDAGFGAELTVERKGYRNSTDWLNSGHYRRDPRLAVSIVVELDPLRQPAAVVEYIRDREDATRAEAIVEADAAVAAAERARVEADEAIEAARARRAELEAELEGTTP